MNCDQCGELMQAEDVADEQTALCPKCTRDRFASVWMEIQGRVCPLCGDPNPTGATHCVACGEPLAAARETTETIRATRVRIVEVFHDAWSVYVSHFVVAFGGLVLGTLLSGLPIAVLVALSGVPGGQIFGVLMLLFWGTFIQLGQARLAVRSCRDQSPQIGDLFAEGKRVFPALIGIVAAGGVSYFVAMLLMVPVILSTIDSPQFVFYLLASTWVLFALLSPIFIVLPLALYCVLVDQERGWIGSYRLALAMVWRNWFRSYIGMLFVFVVFVAGFLSFGIVLLFAVPYLWLLAAVAYLHASGQKKKFEE